MAIADLRPISTRTPAPTPSGINDTRDTGIDLVRAICVIGVVLIHSLMVGVTVTDGGPLFVNASDGTAWIAPLSWLLQVMPLFFVIAGFAGYTSFVRSRNRGGTASSFVAARIHRLLLPAVGAVGFVAIGLTVLVALGVPQDLVGIAGFRFAQPLWFLGVFLLCQVLLPAMVRAHGRAPWRTLALLVAVAAIVDAARILTGAEALGFLNLAFVWLALQQLGFFLADGRIGTLPRRTRGAIGLAALSALLIAVAAGVYSPDLIANINPPTTALLFVGVAHTMLMSLLRERLNAWSAAPTGKHLREFITPRAMTIYLWHMPVLLVMAGASAMFAMSTGHVLPEPSGFDWWMTRPLWLAVVFTLTALVAWALARIEAQPAPRATRSVPRLATASALGIVAIAGLLVVGTTPLFALLAVLMMLTALRLARAPQPGSAE